jgi:hyperosmotically inducible protein
MQNNTIRMLSGVGSAVMLLLLTGCESTPKDERSQGTVIDDEHLAENVRHALDNEPVYKFTDVHINTYAGVVQLSGFATLQSQKSRAQQVTENVNGVRQVVNGIALKPTMQATGRMNSQPAYSDASDQNAAPAQK